MREGAGAIKPVRSTPCPSLAFRTFTRDDHAMSLVQWLFGDRSGESAARGDTETVRRIVAELDRIEPERARYLAAFAYVLSRVAGADLQVSDAETNRIVEIVRREGRLPEGQALLIVEIARTQNRLFGGTENFLVTREFRTLVTENQRQELLDCLFAVSAADDRVSGEEEQQIWQIANELGFSREEYVAARMAYSDKRTVLRKDL
jgi:uncharacterized tellurite resistance protein B-like protein